MSTPLSLLTTGHILEFITLIFSIVIAVTFHEFAHAWTAWKLGDPTPVNDGRVTLNPAAHIDPIGGLMFLLVGFGYGRPVIYNPMYLKRRSDELLVALAGPISNILLAIVFNLIYSVQVRTGTTLILPDLLAAAAYINVALAAFNMIPIPPLDGSAIVAYFWPEYRSVVGGQIGIVLILAFLIVPGILSSILSPIIALFGWVASLFGLL
jgi:Zn-dependent protease